MTVKRSATSTLIHVILIIGSLVMLTPFAWMILTALKTKSEAISINPFLIFPHNGWHFENFTEVWNFHLRSFSSR